MTSLPLRRWNRFAGNIFHNELLLLFWSGCSTSVLQHEWRLFYLSITTWMKPIRLASWNLYIRRNTLQKTSCFTFLFSVFLVCRIIRYICLPIMNDFSTFLLSRQSSTRPYLLESLLYLPMIFVFHLSLANSKVILDNFPIS